MFLCVIILASCADKRKMIDQGIAGFSELQCNAAKLNEKRFELFDKIRILESDTLTNKIAIDSLKNVAEDVKRQSLSNADSLRVKLSNFLTSHDFNEEDRKYIDEQVNAIVEKCKKG